MVDLAPGVTVQVAPPLRPAVQVAPPTAPPGVLVAPVAGVRGPAGGPGPSGPPGPEGASGDGRGIAWFTGNGPPTTVPGSSPGDYYLDALTGNYFRLGD